MEKPAVIKLALPPKQPGNLMKCYQALETGFKTVQEIRMATGLPDKQVNAAMKNGKHQGYFVHNHFNHRWAIAPRATQEAIKAKTAHKKREYQRAYYHKSKAAKQAANVKAMETNAALIRRMARKHQKSEADVVRLSLLYWDRNLYKQRASTKPQPQPRPFWKLWSR